MDLNVVEQLVRQEWRADAAADRFHMTQKHFFDAVFGVVDMWTDTLELEELRSPLLASDNSPLLLHKVLTHRACLCPTARSGTLLFWTACTLCFSTLGG